VVVKLESEKSINYRPRQLGILKSSGKKEFDNRWCRTRTGRANW